ncbi:hypothetical protein GGS24DRAFT_514549 [Hypoxylon argillaceum]|nr:hypothetical protein GGS24DRAFT_514549 [Hypoxylon argillaceum]
MAENGVLAGEAASKETTPSGGDKLEVSQYMHHASNRSNVDMAGFDSVKNACRDLMTSAESRLGIANTETGQSKVQFQYELAFQLYAQLQTEWTVRDNFKLDGITLKLEAQLKSDFDPAFRIILTANGEIGHLKFYVSAELSHLQNDTPLEIEFLLQLKSQTKPDDLWKSVQSISGGDSGTTPSGMVDGNIRDTMNAPLYEANIAIGFVKPVNKEFVFSYCTFQFGGRINYEPKIDYPKLRITNGVLSLALVRQEGQDGKPQYQAFAELAGRLVIERTLLKVVAQFSRVNQEITVSLDIRNTPSATASAVESPFRRLETFSSLLTLPQSSSLAVLQYDLSTPNVEFALFVEFSGQGIKELAMQVYARPLCSIQAEFLKDCIITDLVVDLDLNPHLQTRLCTLSGTLEIRQWQFSAALRYHEAKDSSTIQLFASLERSGSGSFSIIALSQEDLFGSNAKVGSTEKNEEGYLETFTKDHSVPAESGLSLDLAKYYNPSADISFEMMLSKSDSSAASNTSDKSLTKQGHNNPEKDVTADPTHDQSSSEQPGYRLRMAKFRAHFGVSWDIIPGHIALEKMGLAFDLYNPTLSEKQVSGYIYGEWKIENFILWTYVIAEKGADRMSATIGLNIKRKLQDKTDNTLASVLADQKLTGGLGMPALDLHPDIKTSPQTQKLSSGFQLDGHLRIKLLKQGTTEPTQKPKWNLDEIMACIDLEAPLTLFGNNVLVNAYIDLRIKNPLEKSREYKCCLVGSLQSGNLQISIASLIKIKSDSSPMKEESSRRSNDIKAAGADIGGYGAPKPQEDKEDIHFRAMIQYSAEETRKTEVNDILKELSPNHMIQDDDQKNIPPDVGISSKTFASSLNFSFDLHVGKKQGESNRSIKSMALTVAINGSWVIIDKALVVKDSGMKLMLLEAQGQQQKRRVFMMYGIVSLFDATSTSQVAIFYENGILSLAAVVEISLTKLLGGFTGSNVNDLAGTSTTRTAPPLLTEQDRVCPSGIVASVVCTVRNKKFDTFNIKVRSIGVIKLTDSFTIDQGYISYSKAAGAEEKTLEISGTLNWGQSPNQKSLSIQTTFAEKTIKIQFMLNKAPGKMLDEIMGSEAPGQASRPELPDVTGFSGWNSDYRPSSDKTQAVGRLEFEQNEGSTGRQFKRVAFVLKTASNWNWALIEDWIWFTGLEFSLVYNVPDKKLALQLAMQLNYMRRTSKGDDASQKEQPIPDSVQIMLTATKEELLLEFPSSKIKGCNSTDLVYCMTAGSLNIPHWLGIPMFPYVTAKLLWKKKKATIEGHLAERGESWEFSKKWGSIARMENPMLDAEVGFGKSKDKPKASVKGTAVLISAIHVDIEYVLPKGPLLVEGYDIEKIVKMVKRLWNLAKKLWNAGKTLFQIAEAIGSFIASVALAAEGLIDGLLVVGGVLAGLVWEYLVEKLINAFKSLFSSHKDKKDAEDGLRQGTSKHEDPALHVVPRPMGPTSVASNIVLSSMTATQTEAFLLDQYGDRMPWDGSRVLVTAYTNGTPVSIEKKESVLGYATLPQVIGLDFVNGNERRPALLSPYFLNSKPGSPQASFLHRNRPYPPEILYETTTSSRSKKLNIQSYLIVILSADGGRVYNGGDQVTGDWEGPENAHGVIVGLFDRLDGTYELQLIPHENAKLRLYLNEQPIFGSPFTFTETMWSDTVVSGDGWNSALLGEKAIFEIAFLDKIGNPCDRGVQCVSAIIFNDSYSFTQPATVTRQSGKALMEYVVGKTPGPGIYFIRVLVNTLPISVGVQKIEVYEDLGDADVAVQGLPDSTSGATALVSATMSPDWTGYFDVILSNLRLRSPLHTGMLTFEIESPEDGIGLGCIPVEFGNIGMSGTTFTVPYRVLLDGHVQFSVYCFRKKKFTTRFFASDAVYSSTRHTPYEPAAKWPSLPLQNYGLTRSFNRTGTLSDALIYNKEVGGAALLNLPIHLPNMEKTFPSGLFIALTMSLKTDGAYKGFKMHPFIRPSCDIYPVLLGRDDSGLSWRQSFGHDIYGKELKGSRINQTGSHTVMLFWSVDQETESLVLFEDGALINSFRGPISQHQDARFFPRQGLCIEDHMSTDRFEAHFESIITMPTLSRPNIVHRSSPMDVSLSAKNLKYAKSLFAYENKESSSVNPAIGGEVRSNEGISLGGSTSSATSRILLRHPYNQPSYIMMYHLEISSVIDPAAMAFITFLRAVCLQRDSGNNWTWTKLVQGSSSNGDAGITKTKTVSAADGVKVVVALVVGGDQVNVFEAGKFIGTFSSTASPGMIIEVENVHTSLSHFRAYPPLASGSV